MAMRFERLSPDTDCLEDGSGLLCALTVSSVKFIRDLIPEDQRPANERLELVSRIFVHANPHLDEYMAVLLFKACADDRIARIPMEETSIFSASSDHLALATWPTAAIFGIGRDLPGSSFQEEAAFLFDEHVTSGQPKRNSCAMLTAKGVLKDGTRYLPPDLMQLLREVNHIDCNSGALAYHLNNLTKSLWHTRVVFGESDGAVDGGIDAGWKEAVTASVLVAFAFCLKHGIKFREKETIHLDTKTAFTWFAARSPSSDREGFKEAIGFLRGNIFNLTVALKEGFLRQASRNTSGFDWSLDGKGRRIPQLLLLQYAATALHACWGGDIGNLVLATFFESLLQGQIAFQLARRALEETSEVGGAEVNRLFSFGEVQIRRVRHVVGPNSENLWVSALALTEELGTANKALQSYLMRKNGGFGLSLIEDNVAGSRTVLRGAEFPRDKWKLLVGKLIDLEGSTEDKHDPGCWHKTENAQGGYADFLLNGHPSRQYIAQSSLDVDRLAELAANIW